MRVAPFHSKRPGTDRHHNNNKCTEGNNIESYNRRAGTGLVILIISHNIDLRYSLNLSCPLLPKKKALKTNKKSVC